MSIAVKGYPWSSGIGTNVEDCHTAREVIEKAKLGFHVEKCQIVAKMPFMINGINTIENGDGFAYGGNLFREMEGAYATYRTDLNIPLGLVKQKYEVVQNDDAFNFFDDAIGEDKARFMTAGYLGVGQKIFITAKLPEEIVVKGDPVETYLVFSNSHDGSSSINIMFTPVRVFCTNCLNAGLKSSDSYIKIKHTKSAKERLQEGSRILKIACEQANTTQLFYESLAMLRMDDQAVMEYICKLVLTEPEMQAVRTYGGINPFEKIIASNWYVKSKAEISTRKCNILASIWEYYLDGPGQNKIVGSAWGAYNAVTGYYSNVASMEGEARMERLVWGSSNIAMNKALNEVYDIAKAV